MIPPSFAGNEKQTKTATTVLGGGTTGPDEKSTRTCQRWPARLRLPLSGLLGRRQRRVAVFLLAGVVALALSLSGYFYYLLKMGGLDQQLTGQDASESWPGMRLPPTGRYSLANRHIVPAVRLPPARTAADAGIADEAEVIGVSVAGQARAYLVGVMGGAGSKPHVLNDVIGGRAVSVTYCNETNCSRTFTDEGGEPLDLTVGGWVNGKGMVLRIRDVDYLQKTGENLTVLEGAPLPLPEFPHVRTTWKAWREEHPDTDIYIGDPPRSDPVRRTTPGEAKPKKAP